MVSNYARPNYRDEGTYKVIEWKLYMLNIRIHSIEEVIYGKLIALIHVLWSVNRLEHWTDNYIGIKDRKIKDRLRSSEKIPCCLFAKFL